MVCSGKRQSYSRVNGGRLVIKPQAVQPFLGIALNVQVWWAGVAGRGDGQGWRVGAMGTFPDLDQCPVLARMGAYVIITTRS